MSSLVAEATVGAIASQEEPPSQWHLLGRLEKTTIGARGAGGVTQVRRRGPAGCLPFWPHWQRRVGNSGAETRWDARLARMAAQPVLGVEITARRRWQDDRWQDGRWRNWGSLLGRPPSGGVQLAWRDFTSAELRSGAASFDFEVPTELALERGQDTVIGLRLLRLGNAGLTIN